ncbi:MAG: hypothetical protein J6J57_03705 [Alistipes sp.]|nr:hypothetical protein [Alistipes sp.]
MKKILLVLSIIATVFASCTTDKTEGVEAKMPNIVYANVAAGDIYELSFSANLPWVLSISQEAMAYFYFLESEDSTSATYSLRGEAGTHVVKVKVADVQEYDQERVCDIALAMGGIKSVICRLTRTSVSRGVSVFVAQSYDAEADDFAKDADENYLYSSEDISKLPLYYDAYNNVYKQRIKAVATCTWELVEMPDWLKCTPVKATEIGATEISILSNPKKIPYQSETRNMKFADCSDPKNRIMLKTVSVTMPGCDSYLEVSLSKSMTFDGDGEYYNNGEMTEGGAIGIIEAPKGAQIYKVAKNGGVYDVDDNATSWILLENDEWDSDASDVEGIWSRRFNVCTTKNDGTTTREGMLIILPQSLAKGVTNPAMELFNSARTEIKAEYAEYVYNITQTPLNLSNGVFTIQKLTDNMVEVGAELSDAEDWTYTEISKCEKAYKLLYTNANSSQGYYLNPDFEYDTIVYKAWNAEGYTYSNVSPEKSWLAYKYIESEEFGNGYRVEMDITKAQLNKDTDQYEGFIIFMKDNVVVTYLYCVYNENATVGGGGEASVGEITLVDESLAAMHGVTLTQIEATSADYDKNMGAQYGIDDIPYQYRLTYSSREALSNPQYAAMNIAGFFYGQAVGEYTYKVEGDKDEDGDGDGQPDMVVKTGYYSHMFNVEKKEEFGGVVIEPNKANGFDAESIKAQRYEILLFGSYDTPIARIIFDVVAQ